MPDALANWQASLVAAAIAGAVVLVLRPRPSAGRVRAAANVARFEAPRVGGISILLGIIVASLAVVPLDGAYPGILIGMVVAAAAGIVADVRGMPALPMFAAQIVAASVPVAYGVRIEHFTFPFVGIVAELPSWLDVGLTITWIVVLMRLVDFVDGLDGLAAAICGAAAVTFVVLALGLGDRGAATLSAAIAGACGAFLFRNFYPAKLVLGHVGSLVLGFLVATVAIEGLLKTAAVVGVLFPFLVLAVPALDSSLTVARRLVGGDRAVRARADAVGARVSRRAVAVALSVWCAVVALAVVTLAWIDFRAHGEWHPWRTLTAALVGLGVLAASVYVVALIESARARPSVAGAERSPVVLGGAAPASASEAIRVARGSPYTGARRGTDRVLRALDLVIAVTAFALLLPVLALVVGLVLVTSGRPVLHKGGRVGREGRVFTMWKVRTLRPDAEVRVGRYYGAELDRHMAAETTRVGRVLRAVHLDELPQLWNVLTGDMSVVGPRPLRPRFFEELCREIPQYWQRLTVRPGLTGLAQTRIGRGAGWDEKLAHDLEWIADRSVRLYLSTILVTAWRILTAAGSRETRARATNDAGVAE